MQTKIIGSANQGAIAPAEQAVDPLFLAARVALRPLDYTGAGRVLGHFRVGMRTAAIAPAGNGVMGNIRWTDTGSYLVLIRALVGISVITAVTAQRTDPLQLMFSRAYTASETTSVTAITISGNNNKMRTSPMNSSLVTQLAVASAAAGLTGGTSTNDANSLGLASISPALVAIGSGMPMQALYEADTLYGHPPVLAANEGLKVLWGTTTLATGTVTVDMVLSWAEVVLF
jgi:hypothetical protein